MEVINMDPAVQQQLSKLLSVRLCPPVTGQIVLDAVVNRPQPGDPSYQQFDQVSKRRSAAHIEERWQSQGGGDCCAGET